MEASDDVSYESKALCIVITHSRSLYPVCNKHITKRAELYSVCTCC